MYRNSRLEALQRFFLVPFSKNSERSGRAAPD